MDPAEGSMVSSKNKSKSERLTAPHSGDGAGSERSEATLASLVQIFARQAARQAIAAGPSDSEKGSSPLQDDRGL